MKLLILAGSMLFLISGCTSTLPFKDYDYSNKPEFITHPNNIIVTKDDITDRPYEVLKDLKLGYNKTSLFHDDPTPAHVDALLKHEAAKLGADAVILVRYGTVGIGLASWGQLEESGRAVKSIK